MIKRQRLVLALFLAFAMLIIFQGTVYAASFNQIITNSENWKDVYSSYIYAHSLGVGCRFLASTSNQVVLLNDMDKSSVIRVITSSSTPLVFNYPATINSAGFTGADEVVVGDANLDLIKDLPNVNNFIIVGDSYGYDAIAVAPYAMLTNSWVFLVNDANVADIDAILSQRNVKSMITYGYLDRNIKSVLLKYNPEVIDMGDRFLNNVEIVKKYDAIKEVKQVILTNGEFLENEIMSGSDPILFTGKDNVPVEISDYIKISNITVGVLIGNDLVGAATNIRRTTGISVMVKFARGARTLSSTVSAVEGLDLFPVPAPTLSLDLSSINYNRLSSNLEVTYRSNSNVPAFFKGTVTVTSDSGQAKVGDINPIFIAPNDYKTVSYQTNLTGNNLRGDLFTLYGDSENSLDRVLQASVNISLVNVLDRCSLDVKSVSYNKQEKKFKVKVGNIGDVDCWANAELNNVLIDNIKTNLGSDTVSIPKGKTKDILISQEMVDADLSKNSMVDLSLYYGEKEDGLVQVLKGRFELQIETLSLLTYAIIAIIILIIILTIFVIWRKRRNDEF